jgi:hypothetical protein
MPISKVRAARPVVPAAKASRSTEPSAKKPAAPKPKPPEARSARTRGKADSAETGASSAAESPSELIDARIAELGDWRGEMLSRLRALIQQADPEVTEEWKWRGTPVWSHNGLICTGETYKSVVKMTFAKGASLPDPSRLFNSSLEGNVRRAIDFREGDAPDEPALKALIRAAASLNESSASRRRPAPGAGKRDRASESPASHEDRTRATRKR